LEKKLRKLLRKQGGKDKEMNRIEETRKNK
jgi:hypothetical protein